MSRETYGQSKTAWDRKGNERKRRENETAIIFCFFSDRNTSTNIDVKQIHRYMDMSSGEMKKAGKEELPQPRYLVLVR
jgi:hypothetical protein